MSAKTIKLEPGIHFDTLPTQERVHELLRIATEAPPASPMARTARDLLALLHIALLDRDEALKQLRLVELGSMPRALAAFTTQFAQFGELLQNPTPETRRLLKEAEDVLSRDLPKDDLSVPVDLDEDE